MRHLLAAFGLWATLALAAGQPGHGQEPPPGIGGPIELVDQEGLPFSLGLVAGRPALLFFGLIHCGSTCPVALGTARQLLAEFGDTDAPNVMFVTLDPLNDRPADLKRFLAAIDGRVIGLTGDPLKVEQAAERYGVGTRVRTGGVDHSSMWYLLDAKGRVRRVYAHTTPAMHLVADVRALQSR